MIITAIVTMMVTAIISTVARYVDWQLSILGYPLYRFIIWHIVLFAIALAVFYDRRQGFKKSIEILWYIAQWFQRKSHEDKVNATMVLYREHARKLRLRAILLPVAIVLFVTYILSSQMLFFAIVTSSSMEPVFKRGDMVLMQDILVKPNVGDIIIFPDPKESRIGSRPLTVTHRIVGISEDEIKTKGDNNPFTDSWSLSKNNIFGKAVLLNKKPVVLEGAGKYFLLDYTSQRYSTEFLAIAKTIQNMRAMGIIIFFICLILYLFLSIKDTHAVQYFKNR